ncbi:MAG: hypothetical protein SFU56_02625 [Capsulimonadales bacterium]|nr:hypothetical protein [Capsulimonadales bacterium]
MKKNPFRQLIAAVLTVVCTGLSKSVFAADPPIAVISHSLAIDPVRCLQPAVVILLKGIALAAMLYLAFRIAELLLGTGEPDISIRSLTPEERHVWDHVPDEKAFRHKHPF